MRLDPAHAAAHLNRGVLHYQQGWLPEAMTDLKRALELGAEPAITHYNLALATLAADDRAAAAQHVQQSLERDPVRSQALELRRHLDGIRASRP